MTGSHQDGRGAGPATQPATADALLPLDPASVVLEGGRSLVFGLAAGALAGAPAVLRALQGEGTRDPWVLLGLIALPMAVGAPVVLALRRARLPHVVSPGDVHRPSLLRVLGAALALSVAPLAWLGGWLEQSTHHRPLGAVTFACVALCVFAVAAVVGRRLLSAAGKAIVLACLGVPAALGAWLLLRGVIAGFGAGGVWLDGLALVGWVVVAAWLPPPIEPARGEPARGDAQDEPARRADDAVARRWWRGAIASWAAVCALGVVALLIRAPELTSVAPAFTWPIR